MHVEWPVGIGVYVKFTVRRLMVKDPRFQPDQGTFYLKLSAANSVTVLKCAVISPSRLLNGSLVLVWCSSHDSKHTD